MSLGHVYSRRRAVCMCVCVCVCEREGKRERKKERERETGRINRETERERERKIDRKMSSFCLQNRREGVWEDIVYRFCPSRYFGWVLPVCWYQDDLSSMLCPKHWDVLFNCAFFISTEIRSTGSSRHSRPKPLHTQCSGAKHVFPSE